MFQDAKINMYLILALAIYTHIVIAPCPQNCNSCDEQDSCTSCKTGYWDLNNSCQITCSPDCLNKNCGTENGHCIACTPGFYGSRCQRKCSLCEGGLCGSRSCANGCKAGYYEYQDTIDTLCWSCSQGCTSCSNSNVCNVCNSGFYLFKYITNEKLKIACVQCQDVTECSNFCGIQNCDQCRIQGDSGLLCTQCIDGYMYNGDVCIPSESSCAQGCSTDCDNNRICQGSCIVGWTGEQCSDPCARQCLKCDKNNANICEECKSDYYTVTCDVGCDQSCIKEASEQTCRQSDGYCYNGCENNFWGQNCNQSCSEGCAHDGVSHVCDRDTGTCTTGCVEGYIGDECVLTGSMTSTIQSTDTNMRTTTPTSTSIQCPNVENTDSKTCFITGYMSGVGTAVFVVVVTTALYHLRQRYIDKKSKSYQEGNAIDKMPTYYNENASETRDPPIQLVVDANNYESLTSNRNTDKVYSELESQAQQQSHSYYNLDVMK